MYHRVLKGAVTRICPHQIRLWAHQVEAKVPGPPRPPRRSRPSRPARWAAWGTPSDIADVVPRLASLDARWLTGQIIVATGGLG